MPTALTPEQKEILRNFTRGGGTLLTGPPGWKDPTAASGGRSRWRRPNWSASTTSGATSIPWSAAATWVCGCSTYPPCSRTAGDADGKNAVLHLVNYSDYPVENVTVHFLGDYKHATLVTPEGAEKPLEIYRLTRGEAWTSTRCRFAPRSDWSNSYDSERMDCDDCARRRCCKAAPAGCAGRAGFDRQVRHPTMRTSLPSWPRCSTSWAGSNGWCATRPSPSS